MNNSKNFPTPEDEVPEPQLTQAKYLGIPNIEPVVYTGLKREKTGTSMRFKVRVTPSVMRWARQTAGYSVEDIVQLLRRKTVTVSTIKQWESGEERPTYAQLKKLAELYKRPIALFFFPEPPPEQPISALLETLPEEWVKHIPPKVRFIIRKAMARQMDLAEIYDDKAPEEYQKFKLKLEELKRAIDDGDGIFVASRIREYLKVSLKEQFAWGTVGEALKRWRQAVENTGVWVFKEAFREDRYSGFSLADDKFPVIYLNNGMPPTRQIFTLFHELAHQLKHKGGVAFRNGTSSEFKKSYMDDEEFCNTFAREILVPKETLPKLRRNNLDDEEIFKLAWEYKVSHYFVLRVWLDNELITKEFYQDKVIQYEKEFQQSKKEKVTMGGGSYYATQMAYLGEKYLTRLFNRYYAERIDKYQLADYLGVRLNALPKLETIMHKHMD